MSSSSEYLIDGNAVNKLLEPYNLEASLPTSQLHHMLPGQVFELIEKKFIKSLLDEIAKSGAQSVRFVNLEAIASGPHKDYLYAICAGLRVLIDQLSMKNMQVTGTIQDPFALPWSLVAKINSDFKGAGETQPP